MFLGYRLFFLKPRDEMWQAVGGFMFAMLRFRLCMSVPEMVFVLAMCPGEPERVGVFCCFTG